MITQPQEFVLSARTRRVGALGSGRNSGRGSRSVGGRGAKWGDHLTKHHASRAAMCCLRGEASRFGAVQARQESGSSRCLGFGGADGSGVGASANHAKRWLFERSSWDLLCFGRVQGLVEWSVGFCASTSPMLGQFVAFRDARESAKRRVLHRSVGDIHQARTARQKTAQHEKGLEQKWIGARCFSP